jgi:hypothetical protein
MLVERPATLAVLTSARRRGLLNVAVAPGDVASDQSRLGGVVGVIGAGQREVAQARNCASMRFSQDA